jgi:uncharacterized membrane protein
MVLAFVDRIVQFGTQLYADCPGYGSWGYGHMGYYGYGGHFMGMLFIILLMLFAFYNDLIRIFSPGGFSF